MPGVVSSRRLAQPVICSDSWTTNGRGPTRLISPRSTFHSCGSSSMLHLRRNAPTRVMRGSSAILNSGPPPSIVFMWARSKRLASASATIVRNFTIRNSRPPRPWRAWRKNTGPRVSSLTAIAAAARIGEITSRPRPDATMSNVRLSIRTVRENCIDGSETTGTPSMSSIAALDANSS